MKTTKSEEKSTYPDIHYQALQHHYDIDRMWFMNLTEDDLASLNHVCNDLSSNLPIYAEDLLEIELFRDPDSYELAFDPFCERFVETDQDYLSFDDELDFSQILD